MARVNPRVRQLHQYNSYEALDGFLGNRDSRTIANNTTAVRLTVIYRDDIKDEITFQGHKPSVSWPGGMRESVDGVRAIGIILHSTRIITFYEGGGFMVNSGGWKTVTTKQRLNQFLPDGWHISQRDYEWTIHGPGVDAEFYDKMAFSSHGGLPPQKVRDNPMRGQRGHHRGPSPDDAYPSPGKFEGERMLAVEMYDAAMESGADEEEGDSEGPGYYWLFTDFIASDGTPRHGILSENSQGFISLTEYDTATDAAEAWEDEILPMLDEYFEEE